MEPQIVQLEPDSVIVITVPQGVGRQEAERWRVRVQEAFPGRKVVVVGGGATLEPADDPIEAAWLQILTYLGEDPGRDGLKETPRRAAKALLELTGGYNVDVEALFKTFEGNGYDEMVVVRDIEFVSLCEHHVLPFTGRAHVAYVPASGRIIGLSKVARVVDAFAHRLQVQERLTGQIAEAFETYLKPAGVAVVVEATHSCMALRGVKKTNSVMVTSALRGVFLDKDNPAARAEALELLRR